MAAKETERRGRMPVLLRGRSSVHKGTIPKIINMMIREKGAFTVKFEYCKGERHLVTMIVEEVEQ